MNLDRKYRPNKIESVVGHDEIKKFLKAYLTTKEPPHMMFVGPPGIGKNTMAYAFATEYFGRPISVDTENKDRDYLELNASKNRGIDTVREIIEDFASTDSNYEMKRIIFLDEAEGTTKDYQMALRSIMEKWEHNCIFILSLNDKSGIVIPALFSRCVLFEFKPPKTPLVMEWLKNIALKEGICFESDELINDIVLYYKKDMRRILIDCIEGLRGFPNKDRITQDDLSRIFDFSSKSIAMQVFESEYPLKKFIEFWEKEPFDERNFLREYFVLLEYNYPRIFAMVDSRLRDGCNPMIQMAYLFSEILK